MHADEAVQVARSRGLWEDGRYVYDPNEFHGPTLQYVTRVGLWATGPGSFAETTKTTYRLVPVLLGAGLILLLWLMADALGRAATVCAGVLAAFSPAMVFYSRYYIHETLLVFFTLAAIATFWRYVQSSRVPWCLAAGASVGLMQATKETCAITYAAMAVALIAAAAWGRLVTKDRRRQNSSRPLWHLLLGLLTAAIVAALLFSSFFSNPRGPVDAVLTYAPWLGRAGADSIHYHPWYYYLQILVWWRAGDGPLWSEGLIVALAALGFAAALLAKASLKSGSSVRFVRWLGFFTLAEIVAYSAIPYKTPWCLLQFLLGLILLAGVGAVALVRLVPTWPLRGLTGLALLAAAGQLGWQSYRASYECSADPSNPYVYVHTLRDVERLAEDVEYLAEASAAGHDLLLKVIWQDAYYWPLPWYLRRFERVGYYRGLPDDPAAAVVICSPQLDAALTAKLDDTHLMTGIYGIRPNVLALLWVRMDVWEAHLRRLGRL